ncbi:NADH:flavin oxidoreductase NADH oxidase [Fusarium agapanthi]|uniref:NADH:flavin oxidoreductase NADH oxidase n=1 Tax=Fusarium agapanthi TaxID=1803897 RepID=A0A9P5E4G1_9HYPO|nr:NADH:flavin oxidoreductase NADH oxidase [Fusarium agapanthi]
MSSRFPSTPLAEPLHFEFSGKIAPNRFLKAAMTEKLSFWHAQEEEIRGIPSPNIHNVHMAASSLGRLRTQDGRVLGIEFAKSHPASQEELDEVIRSFTLTASYLYQAGFDGVELQGAHGYSLSQFLSLSTNLWTDNYGGNLGNRARLIIDIARSILANTPTGFIMEATFDFVELSGGTYNSMAFKHERETTRKREAFFLDFADMIVPQLQKTKTYVTRGFKTLGGMLEALKTVDGVGVGRAVCQEFNLAKDMLSGSISAAVNQKVDQDDFALTKIIAGSQIRQVGKGKEPVDMSKEEDVQAFLEATDIWARLMEENAQTMMLYSYLDLD